MNGILREYASWFDIMFRCMDVAAVIIITLILQACYPGEDYQILFKTFLIYGACFTLLTFPFFKLYRSWRGVSLFTELRALFSAWACVLIIFNLLIFVLADESQRQIIWPYGLLKVKIFWIWGGLVLALMAVVRIGFRNVLRLLRSLGRNSRTAIIIGAGELGNTVRQTITKNIWLGYKILAFFDDNIKLHAKKVGTLRVRGTLDDVAHYVKTHKVEIVFIALPMRNERRIREIIQELNDTPAEVFLVPDVFNFNILSMNLSEMAGLPVINLNTSARIFGINRGLKWLEDKILSSLILIVISPVMLAISLAIKMTSPGPVFFKQRRYGLHGESVVIYKFRSMSVCDDGDTIIQAHKGDARVTPLGAFLRRTSLDELPQFINVLQGRMSIVGPRPHAVAHNEQYRKLINSYMLRHKVKPGITGWAQINGWRGETDTLEKMEKRVEHDFYYITHLSIWLDLRIVLLTIFKGFVGKNAY